MEEHLPLHLSQARVERKTEERRKAVSKVLISHSTTNVLGMKVLMNKIHLNIF